MDGLLPEDQIDPARERRTKAVAWTEELERRATYAQTSAELTAIVTGSREGVRRLMATQPDLFYRAWHALKTSFHMLIGKEWGAPYNREDAVTPWHAYHPEDPRRPEIKVSE